MIHQSYIGSLKSNNKIIRGDSLVRLNKKCYILDENATEENFKDYEIKPSSLGVSVLRDKNGDMIYTGDTVMFHYYDKNLINPKKYSQKAKIFLNHNIYYGKANDGVRGSKVFLFQGDCLHHISSFERVGR